MIAHIAMNLLHLRADLQWSAARVARVTGADTIEALRAGDEKAALKAMSGLRDEWLVSNAEVVSLSGEKLATYRRGSDGHLESAATQNAAAIRQSAPAAETEQPRRVFPGGPSHTPPR